MSEMLEKSLKSPPKFRRSRKSPRPKLRTPKKDPDQDEACREDEKSPKMKRALSYSDAMQSPTKKSKMRNRKLKSPEERNLRKQLAVKMSSLEKRLLTGEFHHDKVNFLGLKKDVFEDAVKPHIFDLLGNQCEDDPDLVVNATKLCKDIVKKRLHYLKNKLRKAIDVTGGGNSSSEMSSETEEEIIDEKTVESYFEEDPDTPASLPTGRVSPKSNTKTRATPKSNTKTRTTPKSNTKTRATTKSNTKTRATPKSNTKTRATPKSNTKTLVTPKSEEKPHAQAAVYECQHCGKVLKSLDECYPPENRDEFNLLFECKECNQKGVGFKFVAEHAKKEREEIKRRLKEKEKQLLAACEPEQGKTKVPGKFSVGQNVLALWPDENGEPFPAQIFGKVLKPLKYDVYFPQDGEVLTGVRQKTLSLPKKTSKWSLVNRENFLTMGFFHERLTKGTPRNYGKFRPEACGKGKNANKYLCTEISGKNTKSNEPRRYWFDMGYVQRILLKEIYPLHTIAEIYK